MNASNSRRHGLWVTLFIVAVLPMACQSREAREDPHDTARPAGSSRRSRVVPLGWVNGGTRLAFLRVDQFAAGDVGRVACDSTGIYARSIDEHVTRLTGREVCDRLWHAETVAISSDARDLLYTTSFQAGRLVRLDLKGGTDAFVPLDCSPTRAGVDFAPNAPRFAAVLDCVNQGSTLQLVNRDGGARRVIATWRAGTASTPVWSPDGRRILIVREGLASGPEIHVVDTVRGAERLITHGVAPAWAPDGLSVAYLPTDTSREVHVVSLATLDDRVLRRLPSEAVEGVPPPYISGRLLWFPRGGAIIVPVNSAAWILSLTDSGGAAARLR